ncbi:MAG: hypothetical protein JW922_05545 [Paludibacteraceae bacterium]|nr:hypothetical protein [Paludibacteraceae bacterium]
MKKLSVVVILVLVIMSVLLTACQTASVLPPNNQDEFTLNVVGKEGYSRVFVEFYSDAGFYSVSCEDVSIVYDRENNQKEYAVIEHFGDSKRPIDVAFHLHMDREPIETVQ